MQCKNCSSGDFEKLSEYEYRCRYCGSLKVLESLAPRKEVPEARTGRAVQAGPPALLIIVGVIILLGLIGYLNKGKSSPPRTRKTVTSVTDLKPVPPAEFGSSSVEKVYPPEGEFVGVQGIPDSIGNIYFMGMYKNTGKAILRKPRVEVTLYSADGRKVASGRGYGIREVLLPGEETPVRILITRPPAFTRYKITHEPQYPYSSTDLNRPSMKFANARLVKSRYSGFEVQGEIHNADEGRVRSVNIAAVVYDAKKKIIGSGTAYLKESSLQSGEYGPFMVRVTTVRGVPHSFILDYEARAVSW